MRTGRHPAWLTARRLPRPGRPRGSWPQPRGRGDRFPRGSRGHLASAEVRPPGKAHADRIEGEVTDIPEGATEVPDVGESGRGDLGESQDVLTGHVAPYADLASGDRERLRPPRAALHFEEEQGAVRRSALDVV